jgi:hypothetical protein
MHKPDDDQNVHRAGAHEPKPNEVARAIRALSATANDAAVSLTYAIQDAAANLSESVRATGVSILAVLAKPPPVANANDHWPDTNAPFARANGGRQLRPLSEKTTDEKKSLERMRAIREKEGKP